MVSPAVIMVRPMVTIAIISVTIYSRVPVPIIGTEAGSFFPLPIIAPIEGAVPGMVIPVL